MNRVMIFTMHGTTPWWSYLGSQLNFANATVVSDTRGDGDINVVDDFYRYYRAGTAANVALAAYGPDGMREIIRRCRLLRGVEPKQAAQMIGAMHQAMSNVFDRVKPTLCLSFNIDRYVMDVMARIATTRDIRFIEIATSILPGEIMLMERGRPNALEIATDDLDIDFKTATVYADDFEPVYVRNTKKFQPLRFWQVVSYFHLRGFAFNALRHAKRDPLNFHYLEAQSWLPHKVNLRDAKVMKAFDQEWMPQVEKTPQEKRVFLGLQLFPEASMDYWLPDLGMLEHDDVIMRYAHTLGACGFQVFVKDHPLQFGFRRRNLIERLQQCSFVTLVPYDVPATLLIAICGVSITQTGTIGFQAALAGRCSVVAEPYYSTPLHYVHVKAAHEIDDVVVRIEAWQKPKDMIKARREIFRRLVSISAPGNFYSFRKFDATDPLSTTAAQPLVHTLNRYMPTFIRQA